MAKVKMKYLEVAAPFEESQRLLDHLQLCSVMELKPLDEIEGLDRLTTQKTVNLLERTKDTVQTALSILDKYVPEKQGLLAPLKGIPELTAREYGELADRADETAAVCHEICDCEKTVTQAKTDVARIEAARDAIEPWLPLDVPSSFKGTENTVAYIGTLPAEYTAESLETAMIPLLEGNEEYSAEVISHSKDRTCVFVLSFRDCAERVFSALRTLGFAYPSDPTRHPPKVRYERLAAEKERILAQSAESLERIKELASFRDDIKFACDYYSVRCDRYSALEQISASSNIIAFGGYVPAEKADALVGELEEKFSAACTLRGTEDDDDAPVLLKNRPIVAAVEPITEMYALPNGEDPDPNPVMAAFYYLLFGIMLSDAGYGLLMAIGCGIAKFKYKVGGKLKRTVDMYFWCGLATVFWGALFGSWFGDIIPRVAEQFFGINNLGQLINDSLGFTLFHGVTPETPASIALWFEPVNDPTRLLMFSFLFGIIHLFFGVGAGMFKMWKAGNKVGAICDCIPIYLMIIGIAPIGANVIKAGTFAASVTSVSKWIALAGVVMLVLTAGRDSKNIVGKLGIGLYGLYNTASGWLSDILSYSRLLALGLCTGVIATVVNILGTIPDDKAVKLIMLIPVFIFGHVVNMAINLIGTYVHTNRLQYVEFFSKFYEGGGRSFTPLKANTKYYKVRED